MNLKKIRTATFAVLAFAALPVVGQDLIANQAPIDRKLRAVDSVSLQRLFRNDLLGNDANGLYPEWEENTRYVSYKGVSLPNEYRIDLRGFHMPTPSRKITSNYGYRASFRRMHKGIDIKVYTGDTISAAFSGKVRIVRYEAGGFGNYVVIRHNNGLETIYGHLSKQLVRPNQVVKAGQPIGLGGNTGRSFGSHLHFETRLLGEALNPALMFDFVNQDVTGDYYVFRRNTYQQESALANTRNSRSVARSDDGLSLSNNSSKAKAKSVRYHKVGKGETLLKVAAKRGVTVEALCRMNRITRRTKLRAGQILRYS